jgi:hypothetical protein
MTHLPKRNNHLEQKGQAADETKAAYDLAERASKEIR